jgi:dihydromethanopterin reductase (acceptor)
VERRIAWAITGAGHLLAEVFEVMLEARRAFSITTYLSRAAEEVVRIYGLWDRLREISDGRRYSELFTEETEGASSIHAGRLARGVYRALIVAPTTANTVAKISYGIADTLVTNAVAQAIKGETPVYILPTDQHQVVETHLPILVERDLCQGCAACPPAEACPRAAFRWEVGGGTIAYLRCTGCRICIDACPKQAVRWGEVIKVRSRRIDLQNVERLRGMEGVEVLQDIWDLRRALETLMEGES